MKEFSQRMLDDCKARIIHLSNWDREFVDFIDGRLQSGYQLTEAQTMALKRVHTYAIKWDTFL